uniref:Uncharacterized protein n=1 Tax=Onchocerca volvulus TaxID=6282 RepID=A0A8R1Y4F0_ONCVO
MHHQNVANATSITITVIVTNRAISPSPLLKNRKFNFTPQMAGMMSDQFKGRNFRYMTCEQAIVNNCLLCFVFRQCSLW